MSELASRESVLNAIRAAEKEAASREAAARSKAAAIKAAAQAECARMVEAAEMDGRAAMRKAVDGAKEQCARAKDSKVADAAKKGAALETASKARIPEVAEYVYLSFKKELDVKD